MSWMTGLTNIYSAATKAAQSPYKSPENAGLTNTQIDKKLENSGSSVFGSFAGFAVSIAVGAFICLDGAMNKLMDTYGSDAYSMDDLELPDRPELLNIEERDVSKSASKKLLDQPMQIDSELLKEAASKESDKQAAAAA